MKKRNIVITFIGAVLLWACQNDDDGSPAPSEFSIKGKIDDNTVSYEQTIFDGGSNDNVNVFNRADKTLFLQSFKNGENDSEGLWTIRINDVLIVNTAGNHGEDIDKNVFYPTDRLDGEQIQIL